MHESRRHFLITSLLGSVMVAGSLRGAHPVSAQDRSQVGKRRSLGVALVGLGKYSEEQLAPALQRTRHCKLRGIVTGSPHKIPAWQKRYKIPDRNVYSYETLPRIADNPDIDVVYVVVPPSLHAKYAVMAARAGKHVWCEKPMAVTVAECQQIIDACHKNKVRLAIGYRMHHEPNTRTVIEYARSQPYGAIQRVEARAGFGGGSRGWRLQKSMGGGALYDMGVYCTNAIRYSTGLEPLRVTRAAQVPARKGADAADQSTEFELELPNGIVALGRTSFVESMNRLRVDCAGGWYELSPMQSYTGVQGRTSDGKRLNQHIDSQQARQMDDDALAILEGKPTLAPGEDGLADIRVVEAIVRAAESGRSVSL